MRGLINGTHRLRTSNGAIEVEEIIDPSAGTPPAVVFVNRQDDSVLWRTSVDDLRADPTSSSTASTQVDFRGFLWQEACVVGLAGDSMAVF
jgi:hypothetical protein